MSSTPLQSAPFEPVTAAGGGLRERTLALLAARRFPILGQDAPDAATRAAGVATSLMEAYRRSGEADVFECLVQWTTPQLLARIRTRMRGCRSLCEPTEVLQDVLVNIYRYPDRFLASRAGAFAAWSTTIVDNAIRRRMRTTRRAFVVTLQAPDVLADCVDAAGLGPDRAAADHEACEATIGAFLIVLQAYLRAFATLSPREQAVLREVEVEGRRYVDIAADMAVRMEAVKMIVFRARKRVLGRATELLHAAAHGGHDGHGGNVRASA
jgi:RNA polymerase sigma factor (sigma-70 family)